MMKKFSLLLCLSLFCFVAGFSQGHETFDSFDEPGTSYVNGTFEGQDGSTWEYTQSRGDYEITGTALMLGRNRTPDAELISGTLNGGIGTLEFSYMQAFSNNVNMEVYVNDDLVYTATSDDELDVVKSSGEIDVNVDGDFTLRFFNPNGGAQVVIDDVIWTAFEDDGGNGEVTPECEAIAIDGNSVSDMAMTCRDDNLLNGSNVTVCGSGSTLYLGGNEAVYTYSPSESGIATISYTGQTWSGIFVFQGCPTAGGECVDSVTSSNTSKELTFPAIANTTYYIVFDTYPSPVSPCPGTFSINLVDACEGTPDAGAITLDSTEGIPGSSATISATGYSEEAGLSYSLNYRLNEGDWQDLATTTPESTEVNFDGNPGDVFDVRLGVTCNISLETSYSESVSYTLTTPEEYCVPTYTYTSDRLSQISSTGASDDIMYNASVSPQGGYADETTSILQTEAGAQFTISTSYVGGGNAVKIWIDWDANHFFASDEVLAYEWSSSADKTFNITIPEGVEDGSYRMRVRGVYSFSEIDVDPCNNANYGSTVDFTLLVGTLDACTGAEGGTAAETEINLCAGVGFSLSVTGSSDAADGLIRTWQSSPAGQDDWTDIEFSANTTLNVPNGVAENTDYRYYVSCGDEVDTSEVISVVLNPATMCYCTPSISSGCVDDELTNFSLTHDTGTINYDDGCTGSSYYDFTDTVLYMTPGESYTGSANSTSSYTEAVSIWIDLNQDGLFSPEERLTTVPGINAGPVSFTIEIPETALSGQTRMRVGQNFSSAPSNPCSWTYGMALDYTIEIGGGESCTLENLVVDNVTSNSADLTWEVEGDCEGGQFEVVYGASGFDQNTEGQTVSVTDPLTTLTNLNGGTEYDVYVRYCNDAGCGSWSSPLTFTTEELVLGPECDAIAVGADEVTDMAMTCRDDNLLNGTNVTVCGSASTSYLGGTEAVYTYTPSQSGIATISYSGQTWSAIFVFQGCPTAGGECVDSVSGSTSSKELTFPAVANTTYYIVFDTFPSPASPCPGSFSIVLEDGCEGTPDAGAITIDSTEGLPGSSATISATGYSEDAGVSYALNYRVNEGDWQDLATTTPESTEVTFNGNPGDVYDVRLGVTCNLSLETSYSESVSYTLTTPEDYCIPTYTYTSDRLSHISSTGASDDIVYNASSQPVGGYADETTSILQTEAGAQFTIATSYVGGGNAVKIWVDWDNNHFFGSDEVLAYEWSSSADKTFNITIPEGVEDGTYRMRVRGVYSFSEIDVDSCNNVNYGSAVDFTLLVGTLDACTGAEGGTAAETEINLCAGTGFSLSVSGASDAADGLIRTWQFSPSGQDDWTDIEFSANTTLNVPDGVTENTDYRYYVSCGDTVDTSEVISVILNPANECYCTPSIIYGCSDDELTNFSLTHDTGTVNYDDGCTDEGPYYDFTDTVLYMTPGESYTGSANSISSYGEAVSIWIDLNQDGLFSEEERLTTVAGINAGPISFTIEIPETALTGQTRMRVGQNYSSAPTNACSWSYGMALDYTINFGEESELPCEPQREEHDGPGGVNPYKVDRITKVQLGTLNDMEQSPESFVDNTDGTDVPELFIGQSHTLQIDGNGSGNHYAAAWIDFDNSDTFDNSELLGVQSVNAPGSASINFTVPESAAEGQYRLRVVWQFASVTPDSPDPCTEENWGQTKDYSVNIVSVPEPEDCPDPEDVFIDDITSDSALVMWEAGADPTGMQFEVIYGLEGFDVATEGESVIVEDPIVTLEGLASDTEYDVYVRALCTDGGESDWVGPETFTTAEVIMPECPAPTDLTVVANPEDNESSVIVTWTAGGVETMWFVVYGETGFTLDDDYNTEIVNGEPSLVITGLDQETNYDVYVVAACDAASDNVSLPTGPFTFNILDLSISEVEFKNFAFYPNPVDNHLNLQANSPIENVEVYNLLGQLVSKIQPMSNAVQLDAQSWQSGVYLMKVTLNGVEKTFRVIRK